MNGEIKLPPRLALIADLVPGGTRLADVGSDHALLPIRLLMKGVIRSAVATDIHAGPIKRAEANARRYGVTGLRCVQCDGLAAVSPEEADTVVIAGMGGETIAGILRAAPWVCEDRLLILQPMSRPEILRETLSALGLCIETERLVEDSGRIYAVLTARTGVQEPFSEAETYVGIYPLVSREPLFDRFLGSWEKRIDTAVNGLAGSGKQEDAARLRYARDLREQMKEMRERYAHSR